MPFLLAVPPFSRARPLDRDLSRPGKPTVASACAAGVDGEEGNIAMYDRLLALELPADVVKVFQNLRTASAEKHLPAFLACAGG